MTIQEGCLRRNTQFKTVVPCGLFDKLPIITERRELVSNKYWHNFFFFLDSLFSFSFGKNTIVPKSEVLKIMH